MGHGGMSCGMKTMRFVMVVFNIIFFLVGLALLALGIYIKVDPSLQKIKQILPINGNPGLQQGLSYLDAMAIAILVIGSVLLIIGFLGCCGAMKQVKIFLGIYVIIVGIIIAVEVGITIYFVAFKSKFEEQIKPKLTDALVSTYEGPNKLITKDPNPPSPLSVAWDFIMYNFQCCGVNNGSDFLNATKWNRTNPWWNSNTSSTLQNFTYPITCCNIGNVFKTDWNNLPTSNLQQFATCAATGNGIYSEGCYNKFMDVLNSAKTWIILGAVLILVIELVALIFALVLCCQLIIWKYKPKQFLQINIRFERKCEINRPLTIDEHISWILYYHDGRIDIINKTNLIINSFTIDHEGIAICQIKDKDEKILDEKYFFMTNDPTDLIDYRFEGYDKILIDSDINNSERHCGPDVNIEYVKEDIADFHIDFVQHYERIRQHSNHIQLQNIKHENEGYYECIVRLHNGLVGVRVFFLSVGGGPRQISNRETHIYSEINDSITLLCPIFSAVPAWYTFIIPKDSTFVGHDYLRIKHISNNHSGMYTCRVTTNEENEGYSLTANFYLDVYGPPEYIEPYINEYTLLPMERNIENLIRCSIHGNPMPSYKWFLGDIRKENEEEILSNKIDYIITSNENDAPGLNRTLTCIAKNNRGSKRQVFTLQLIN